jgi:hypothetical protein
MFWPDFIGHLQGDFYNMQHFFNVTIRVSHMIKMSGVVLWLKYNNVTISTV